MGDRFIDRNYALADQMRRERPATDSKAVAARLRDAIDRAMQVLRDELVSSDHSLEAYRILSASLDPTIGSLTAPVEGMDLETTVGGRKNAAFNLQAHLDGIIKLAVPEGVDNTVKAALALLRDFDRLHAQLAAERARAERMAEALDRIDQWSRAYPLSVFPEPDFAKAAEVLKAAGMTLDAISASNMRHVVEGVGEIARAALTEKPT